MQDKGKAAAEIKEGLRRNKREAEEVDRAAPMSMDMKVGKPSKGGGLKAMPQQHKMMAHAIEQMVQESGNKTMPSFARGPEIEISTLQDVEMLKQMLAQIKVHIPTKSLERGIVMPRDLDQYHPQMPKVIEHLMVNPYKEKKDEKKKKKRKAGDDAKMMRAADTSKAKDLMAGGPLGMNEKLQY